MTSSNSLNGNSLCSDSASGNLLSNDRLCVHVIDDDRDVRNSVDWTLRSVGYRVEQHADPQEFLQNFDKLQYCCLIVDLLMPRLTGIKLCERLVRSGANCAFVMLTGHGDVPSAVGAMQLGAVDFLEKPVARQKLLAAVQLAFEKVKLREQEAMEDLEIQKQLEMLSPREREIFDWMIEGFVTKEIAARLGISRKTVDVHRSKISQKLRIDSPSQLGHIFSLHLRGVRRRRVE